MTRHALLVTRSDDHHGVTAVAAGLRARKVTPIRLDTDRFPLDVQLSTRIADGETHRVWRTAEGAFEDANVCSVWHRRFFAGGRLPHELGDLLQPSVDESRRSLYGTIAALDVPHMDRLEDVRRTDHKELQLLRARKLGLRVPSTLFSNDPAEVRAFYAACAGRMITKMQSSFAVYRGGSELVVFTNVVDEDALKDLTGLRYCPMQFQELIDKRIELRATVVGEDVFCAAVDSQQSDETRLDWRKDGVGLLKKWTKHQLPSSTAQKLVSLVRSFGLSYAAADFIVTPDDDLVFLEINAGGEWYWLDEHVEGSAGLPIADAIAAWLAR